MKSFYRLILGRKSIHAESCFIEGFIGADFGVNIDLTNQLTENWRDSKAKFRDIFKTNQLKRLMQVQDQLVDFSGLFQKGI